ncbi:MAG: hypothetical protein QOK41_1614, partial [Sphingomonadales bacterium]|nr:hypothetical protein [Sphingomonadales bacterium]
MKSAAIAFGTLMWAAPVFAQAAPDPLAPLPVKSTTQPSDVTTTPGPVAIPATQQPIVVAQTPPPPVAIFVPKDWRGVFDAIDAGNWASAQAGIAALPRSVLTP